MNKRDVIDGLMPILFWVGALYTLAMGCMLYWYIADGLKWGEFVAFLMSAMLCVVLGFGVYFIINKLYGAKLVEK